METGTNKTKQKPKYDLWQITAYMLGVAWRGRHWTVFTVGLSLALVTAGNHEFAIYIGDGEKENAEYRNRSLATVQSYFPNDIRFYAREMGGVKLIGMDDGYYLFEEWQLERLKQEAADGMPISFRIIRISNSTIPSRRRWNSTQAFIKVSAAPA